MAVEKLNIDSFLRLAQQHPIIDVRSPGEYNHAHIPGAYNLPLFTDEERKIVGTIYKQKSREEAIKIGLEFFGPKMKRMIEEVESICSQQPAASSQSVSSQLVSQQPAAGSQQPSANSHQSVTNNYRLKTKDSELPTLNSRLSTPDSRLLIYCWRGGMRSAAIAWLMDLYGFKVYTLAGGYKKFRNYVLDTFKLPWRFKLLGGYTGSGKTETLKALEQKGQKVIDLEKIAGHKGSAFGNIGLPPQPTQEMFENLLSCELRAVSYELRAASYEPPDADANGRHSDPEGRHNSRLQTPELLSTINYQLSTTPIWLEDESQRIGQVNIPNDLWKIMRQSPVYFLDIPFEVRLQHLTEEYGGLDPERMLDAISRIGEKLGGLNARLASQLLIEGNIHESFRILLEYYDRAYLRSLHNREGLNSLLHTIESKSITVENANLLIRYPESSEGVHTPEKPAARTESGIQQMEKI